MSNPSVASSVRAKKLGLLIYDARMASRRNEDECAQAIGVPISRYQEYEAGLQSPSLPEIELLAYFLQIPLDHFWGNNSLLESTTKTKNLAAERIILIRQRMVGVLLQQARLKDNLSIDELATKIGIDSKDLQIFENGVTGVPFPILQSLSQVLGVDVDYFIDHKGTAGKWLDQQKNIDHFISLPDELQEFISLPKNKPYIELAFRLNELSVEKLRSIAESLLEITY